MKVGNVVLMPFAYADGVCDFCYGGLYTLRIHLDEVPAGYCAMQERRTIKVLVRVGAH